MANISRKEIIEILQNWKVDSVEKLENGLGRELTDGEIKDMLIYLMGYFNFDEYKNLGRLVKNIGLRNDITNDEYNKIRDIEC